MSLWPVIIIGATLFVAFANGANDDFKGVAALFGGGTTNYRQALAWATMTSFLVIFASKWGMPVSTTHVSCGALFGIGIVNGRADWNVIRMILLAWVLTLPTAALLSATSYFISRHFEYCLAVYDGDASNLLRTTSHFG